jgi:hypothetical protein
MKYCSSSTRGYLSVVVHCFPAIWLRRVNLPLVVWGYTSLGFLDFFHVIGLFSESIAHFGKN